VLVKILFVANSSFFLHNFLLGIMRRAREEGYEVVAAAPFDNHTSKVEAEGFPVSTLQHLDRKGSNPIRDFRFMRELLRTYHRERPDLVLHFTIKPNVFGGIAARLARVSSIPTVTGLGWLFTDRSAKAALGAQGYKVLYRMAFRACPRALFLNEDDRAFFVEQRLTAAQRSLVIPGSGVDTERFASVKGAGDEDTQKTFVFLLIGRLLWDKGIGEFVEAAAAVRKSHPNAQFQLLGPMDQENRAAVAESVVRTWVEEGTVVYLGRTDDVRPFIAQSDVVVLPSYREGLPSSLLEAMSMARPVIAGNVPGSRGLVENGETGFLVEARNAVNLADRVIACLEMGKEGLRAMGEKAREKVLRDFDSRKASEAYVSIINETLKRKAHARTD
jgi:glycosyltransferase involved in cell wall biosynthesis